MHLRFIDNYSKIKEKKSKLLTTTSKTTRATTKITKATVKTTLLFGWSHGPLVFSIASSQGSFVSFIISKYDCPSVTQFLSNTSHSFQLWTRNSIRGFVRQSVCWSVMIELKSGKTSILDNFCVCLCVGSQGWELGCGSGLDAPAHPSATIL